MRGACIRGRDCLDDLKNKPRHRRCKTNNMLRGGVQPTKRGNYTLSKFRHGTQQILYAKGLPKTFVYEISPFFLEI
ncbi:hypothetical protein J2S17_002852 [Cytobacillus purgationiresistens]|uniref:Uncharacterized protein n=1 Tax=Cytobacillus purgationiresistens TaxID=863449 RepID=A0ABU0AJS7_9BACI|nr:hypothetical protein [Cytobacillus purgationiresistens]